MKYYVPNNTFKKVYLHFVVTSGHACALCNVLSNTDDSRPEYTILEFL